MRRTFVAIKIPVSNQTVELINDIRTELKDDKIRWVESCNMHITLFFLGDTEEEIVESIANELSDSLMNFKSFSFLSKGLGVFKSIYNPKVIWFGLESSKEIIELKKIIDKAIKPFGFKIDKREFKPHLTLGRVKFIKNRNNLKSLIEKYKEIEIQDFKIDEVVFYESKLTPQGPIYKVIREFCLN